LGKQLPEDFLDLMRLFSEKEVEYLLIGGYAVGYYGYVRTTDDIDFFVGTSENNASRIVEALVDFGFHSIDKTLFVTPENVVRIGVAPLRVEILTTISGVSFEDCYANKEMIEIEGLKVPMIALEDLKINKKSQWTKKG
jgi:predicted nucleotidyltransferase